MKVELRKGEQIVVVAEDYSDEFILSKLDPSEVVFDTTSYVEDGDEDLEQHVTDE